MPDEYFHEEIAEPLGIDSWFRLPEGEGHRVTAVVHDPDMLATELDEATMNEIRRQRRIMPSADILGLMNEPRYLYELFPSAWGKGNARAVGKLFAALSVGGTLDGYAVVSRETLEEATTLQWEGTDSPETELSIRFAMGLYLNTPSRYWMGPNPDAFGANGAGGNVGFADPDRHLAFGYCANTMAAVTNTPECCEDLIDAVYEAI